jgi:hypothetical protein
MAALWPHARATGRARPGRAHGAHASASAHTRAYTPAHAQRTHTRPTRPGLVTRQRPLGWSHDSGLATPSANTRACARARTAQHTQRRNTHPPPPTPHTHTHALACAQTPPAVRRAPSTWPSTSGATRLAAQPPAPARAATHVVPRTSSHKHRPHPAQRQTSPSAVAQTAAICLMTEDWQAWVVLHRLCDAHRACSGSSDPGVRARCQHRPSARPRCFAAGCAATHIDGRLAAARPCVGERPRVQGGRPGVSAACMRCS